MYRLCSAWLIVMVGYSFTPGVTAFLPALPYLPEELAAIVKQMSYDAGWAISAKYVNSQDHYDRNVAFLRINTEALRKKSGGLLSSETVDDLKDLLWNVASFIIWGQKKYETIATTKFSNIFQRKEMSLSLLNNITEMAKHTAWCTLNKNMGRAQRCDLVDQHNVKYYFDRIRGTPRVKSIVFSKDDPLKIGSPFEDADIERVNNPGSEPIIIKKTYTERHGHTRSISQSLKFTAKVSAGFTFGFSFWGVETGTSFSFESSTERTTTFTGEAMKESTVQREYSFTVAPGKSAIISIKQGQLDLRLRYTVELDFDGYMKNMTGIWEGTASSALEVSFIPID